MQSADSASLIDAILSTRSIAELATQSNAVHCHARLASGDGPNCCASDFIPTT
jgi:hypothetical protein